MNETFTGAAQVDADASPQADGAPSAARIVTGLSRLPGSSSGRYAARIVTGLSRLPGSSSGRYAARIVTGLSRLPGSSSGRYAARIVTGLKPGGALARGLAAAVVAAAAAYGCARRWWTVCPCAASDLGRRGAWSAGCRDRRQG
ncbi:Uncharacterised protein [Mycobacterium tuberculosis]|nr:Uncharacterised protein [Mycobacterium tuberculosis]SGC46328.1 Uncharacterised protein [Mycobacterium tuberculosis]